MANSSDEIIWEALRRECASVAQHLGIGATAIGRANYEQTAAYAQSFFALSIGFERAAKLALTLDSAVSNGGRFLDSRTLRSYGHRLDQLLRAVDGVARAGGISAVRPDTDIHQAIIATLTQFASNIGRYFNLEVLSESSESSDDPIAAWYTNVTRPVLKAHDTESRRARDEARVDAIAVPAASLISVIATAETGEPIRDLPDLMRRNAEATTARPWERMYILQIARFLTYVIGELGKRAQAVGLPVPYLDEFFYDFQLDDQDFRRLKNWPTGA